MSPGTTVLAVIHLTVAALWLGSMSYSLTALAHATGGIPYLTARFYGLDSLHDDLDRGRPAALSRLTRPPTVRSRS